MLWSEVVVEAQTQDIDVLSGRSDRQEAWHAECSTECGASCGTGSETVVEIFCADAPLPRNHPFIAAAEGPARLGETVV